MWVKRKPNTLPRLRASPTPTPSIEVATVLSILPYRVFYLRKWELQLALVLPNRLLYLLTVGTQQNSR